MKNTTKNLDDIIFENRNKDYGAYSLRKTYNKNIMSAVVIAIVIFLVGVSLPLIANYFNNGNKVVGGDNITVTINNAPKEKILAKLPEAPKEIKKVITFKPPLVVTGDEDVPDDLMDIMDNAQNTNPDDAGEIAYIPDDKPNTNIIDEDEELKVHIFVDEFPEFPGGDEGRVKFLSENISYPQVAKETGIQGPVYLTFVVEKDGNISNVKILRGIGGGCDEEALRVVSSMPKWKPGRQNGKEVRVQFNMPITFTLR